MSAEKGHTLNRPGLDHARGLAREIVIHLTLAHDRARVFDRDLERVRRLLTVARTRTHARGLVRDRDLVRDRVRDRDLERARTRSVALVRDLEDTRTRGLDLGSDPDLDLDHDLQHAKVLAVELLRVLNDPGGIARRPGGDDFAVIRNLASVLLRVRDLVRELNFDLDYVLVGSRTQHEARRVAPWAAGLLGAAARLLPAPDRARYAEEYHSELCDLAQVGAARLSQLGYALRQLRSAPRTRLALRSPRRRGATP